MTSDKEALEQQHQPTSKSAIFSPAPSLTNIGQPQAKLASRLQEGSQLVQKSKLILPTAIWILIVVGGLCFLSLLASLNKSINTLDALVQQEQAKVDTNRNDDREQSESLSRSPISDLMSLPSWLSLDRQPFGQPISGGNGLSTAETSIIITDGGSPKPQIGSLARPLDLLDNPSMSPIDSMLSQLFGQSSADQVNPTAQEDNKSGSPFIDKIHINKLNININPPATEGEYLRRPYHRPQKHLKRPLDEAEKLEQGSGTYNKMIDNMLLSMLKPPVRGPQEVGELSMEPPSDRPIPMSPLAQLHLLPFEPEISVGGPRPHSPLDSSIPPMFGRPQDGQQAHIVIAQFASPSSGSSSLLREPARPTPDSNIEEPPRQADIPIRVISNEPDVLQSLELPKFNDDSSSTAFVKDDLENASSPMTPEQQKSTSADDGIYIKPTTNRVADLFKMFFGEPKDSLVVRPLSEEPVEVKSPQTVTIKVGEPAEDTIVKVPIEPFKGEHEGESSEEKKDIEQMVDNVMSSMLSLPQMANEQAPIKINSSTPVLPIIPVHPGPHAHRHSGPSVPAEDAEQPPTNTSTSSQPGSSVSNKTTSAAPIRTTFVVGLKADSIPTTTVAPETTARKSASSVNSSLAASSNSNSSSAVTGKDPIVTTKVTGGSSETPKPTTASAPTSKKPDRSFFEKADEFLERNILRFKKFLE